MRPLPDAQYMTNRRTKFKNYVDEDAKRKNKTKSSVRAKVEHPCRILKRVFEIYQSGVWWLEEEP